MWCGQHVYGSTASVKESELLRDPSAQCCSRSLPKTGCPHLTSLLVLTKNNTLIQNKLTEVKSTTNSLTTTNSLKPATNSLKKTNSLKTAANSLITTNSLKTATNSQKTKQQTYRKPDQNHTKYFRARQQTH